MSSPNQQTSAPKDALVVRGGWEGHQPVEATDLFVPFLEANGYDVRIEGSPSVYVDAGYMRSVDLIVQSVSMGTIEDAEVAGLRSAVEAGAGFAGWHGGIVDSYRGSAEYLQLVGGQFVAHPGKAAEELTGGSSDNDRRHTIRLMPSAATHPITRGLGDVELTTEQYWVLTDAYNDVLATTTQPARPGDPWHREITCPAVWTRRWGAGRVFVATPGHSPEVLREPTVRAMIERGLLWASR